MRARWMWMGATVAVVAVWLGGCNTEPGLAASFDYALSARFTVPDLHPLEEQGDWDLPYWAGIVPLETKRGQPIPCERLAPGIGLLAYLDRPGAPLRIR